MSILLNKFVATKNFYLQSKKGFPQNANFYRRIQR